MDDCGTLDKTFCKAKMFTISGYSYYFKYFFCLNGIYTLYTFFYFQSYQNKEIHVFTLTSTKQKMLSIYCYMYIYKYIS